MPLVPALVNANIRAFERAVVVRIVIATAAIAINATAFAAGAGDERTHSLVGTIRQVDGQTLIVQSHMRTETFTLAAATKLRIGAKMVTPADLVAKTGSRVKVRYFERSGSREVSSVTVSSAEVTAQERAATANHAVSLSPK